MQAEKFKISTFYILICLIWGSTWLVISFGLDSLQPFISAGLRFAVAALIVAALMKFRKVKLQTDKASFRLYLELGLFSFVMPYGLVYWGQQYVHSGLAAILFAVYPFFIIIFTRIAIPTEAVGSYKLMGVILGFLGIVAIFSESLTANLGLDFYGMLAIVLSAMLQAGVAVRIKKFGHHLHPLAMNFIPLVIAGVILTALSFIIENPAQWVFDEVAISTILYLAFFGTAITFTFYYWLLKRINIVILALVAFITPIVAVIFGWLFRNEEFASRHLIGSGLVLLGILLANLKELINYYSQNKVVAK